MPPYFIQCIPSELLYTHIHSRLPNLQLEYQVHLSRTRAQTMPPSRLSSWFYLESCRISTKKEKQKLKCIYPIKPLSLSLHIPEEGIEIISGYLEDLNPKDNMKKPQYYKVWKSWQPYVLIPSRCSTNWRYVSTQESNKES